MSTRSIVQLELTRPIRSYDVNPFEVAAMRPTRTLDRECNPAVLIIAIFECEKRLLIQRRYQQLVVTLLRDGARFYELHDENPENTKLADLWKTKKLP